MPQFTVNASRLDPYKGFKFRIVWDGRVVAGVSRISPLAAPGTRRHAEEAISLVTVRGVLRLIDSGRRL